MGIVYSAARGGFFTKALHRALPTDAVHVTAAEHRALLDGQARGLRIVPDAEGRPTLQRPTPPRLRVIAAHAFRARLPLPRREAITAAAVRSAAAGDAAVLTWLMDQTASTTTDLDDPRTVAGVVGLLSAGAISQAEHDALLADGNPNET